MDRGAWWATVHGVQRVGHNCTLTHSTLCQTWKWIHGLPFSSVTLLGLVLSRIYRFFFFLIYIFYWSIMDLQCFMYTARWFSDTYTYILFFKLFFIIDYYRYLLQFPVLYSKPCCLLHIYFFIRNLAFYSYQVKQLESKCH